MQRETHQLVGGFDAGSGQHRRSIEPDTALAADDAQVGVMVQGVQRPGGRLRQPALPVDRRFLPNAALRSRGCVSRRAAAKASTSASVTPARGRKNDGTSASASMRATAARTASEPTIVANSLQVDQRALMSP